MTIYAIGDIHGQLGQLRAAHDRIAADREREGTWNAQVVHVGDLVDRGPDSKGVIDFLLEGLAAGEDWVALLGNHDRMFRNFVLKGELADPLLSGGATYLSEVVGGLATLASYGVTRRRAERQASFRNRARAAVPEAHRDFLATLPLYHRYGSCLFVHAGVRPGIALSEQSEDDLVWIRDAFLWHTGQHPWLVIHGHTPVDHPEHYGNRVNIDTGAGYGDALTAIAVEGRDVFVLTDAGRETLTPLR